MKRLILNDLKMWQKKSNRKPLILSGVRQTGKTYSLKEFGKDYFPACHYLNFEQNKQAAGLFKDNFDPQRILSDLSFMLDTSINPKDELNHI